ncbi:MAG: hypothetical protein ACRDK8_15625 [Solirubrobacteraceae bacterium]
MDDGACAGADDHPSMRRALVRIVTEHADLCLVGDAEDGRHARELVAAERPDVALLDVRSQHFTDLSVEPREFIDAGDTVAVVARISATGSAGSVRVDSLHLGRLRDRKAVSFTEYMDTGRTLQATES